MQVTITGFDLSSYRQCLSKWNHAVELMHAQCRALGARCLAVRYEALVLAPAATLRRVLRFLDLRWDDAVLHHERYINQPNGVALSKSVFALYPSVHVRHLSGHTLRLRTD